MYLLDTDILVGLLREKKNAVEKIEQISKISDNVFISVLNVFELIEGAYLSSNKDKSLKSVFDLIENIEIINLNKDVSVSAGKISADLKSRGAIIGIGDILIGASAILLNLILITNNKKHFERIPGLKLEVW